MERIAKDTYEGKIKPGQLDPGHVLKTHDELNAGAKSGYGKNWQVKTDGRPSDGRPSDVVLKMQKNIFRFSGAKNATMLKQINQLLEKDGKQRSWNEFKQDVLRLNGTYNKNYLQAEFQTAKQAGKMADLWADYEDNKTLFPNLKYKTQGDDKVREEHDRLKDIIKPIDDKFWDSFYPPNGWRCFVPETLILTEKGWKQIKDIKRGDYLIGGSGNNRYVGELIINEYTGSIVVFITKRNEVSCTPNHRFFTPNGWQAAEDICTGDIIIQIGKIGLFNKTINAICNTITLFKYCLMSFKRQRKSSLNVNN